MNYVLVRTKLQALIVMELLRGGLLAKPFVFVPLYQLRKGEDSDSVSVLYESIAAHADRVRPMVQEDGLLRNAAWLALAAWHCSATSGCVYAAVLDFYALALALKLAPSAKLISFDDGTANIEIRDTSYHSEIGLQGTGVRKAIGRLLFPKGSSSFCRTRILQHYTIYPEHPNVVSNDKLIPIQIRWSDLVPDGDRAIIPHHVSRIMLGTTFHELPDVKWRPAYEWALAKCDIYLPHPRERRGSGGDKLLQVQSAAESLILYLLERQGGELTVYHFGSSVAITMAAHPRVRCVDLFESVNKDDANGTQRPHMWGSLYT